jgi:hypothetical protein
MTLRRLPRSTAARVIPQVVAGSMLLLGCAAKTTMAVPNRPGLTVDTPLNIVAADARGRAVLEHDVPGVLSNPKYPLFEDMSLAQVATISSGRITQEKLDMVEADLDKLAAEEAAGK